MWINEFARLLSSLYQAKDLLVLYQSKDKLKILAIDLAMCVVETWDFFFLSMSRNIIYEQHEKPLKSYPYVYIH